MTTAQMLASAFALICKVQGPLSLMLSSGRGLRKSDLRVMRDLLLEAERTLGRVAGE
jgi:hypothetical protein